MIQEDPKLGTWEAQALYVPCLPNVEQRCGCDLLARLDRRDCAVTVVLPPAKSERRPTR